MSTAELGVAIQSLLSLIVLVIVVFSLWPAQRVDLFRQQMFALRDELFDFAADGNISFEDPAYVLLRQLMNGFIRYAHNLTPYRTLMTFLKWKYFSRDPLTSWSQPWNTALSNLADQGVKERLQEFHNKTAVLVGGQLLLSPGMLIFVVPIVVVLAILRSQLNSLRNMYNAVQNAVPMLLLEEEAARS